MFYDANGRMVDVQHKGCRGIVPKYDEFGEHPETIVEYELEASVKIRLFLGLRG